MGVLAKTIKGWRSDLSKIEIIDENRFDECTRNGFVTHFQIIIKEPCQKYQFDMENQNMSGCWSGIFEDFLNVPSFLIVGNA